MGMTYPIQIGNAINYTNTGLTTLTGRDVVALSNGCGIVQADIAAGATGTLLLSGVHKVPAVTTAAFAVGDLLYWDAANSKATKAALNNVPLGMCIDAKAQSGATALVKLGATLPIETLPIETPESLSYTNSGASEIAAGAVVALGNCCGIAAAAIAASASGVVYISGTYTVAADTTAAFALGDLLYWNSAGSKAVKAAAGNVPLGICVEAKASAGATCNVKIGVALALVAAGS